MVEDRLEYLPYMWHRVIYYYYYYIIIIITYLLTYLLTYCN